MVEILHSIKAFDVPRLVAFHCEHCLLLLQTKEEFTAKMIITSLITPGCDNLWQCHDVQGYCSLTSFIQCVRTTQQQAPSKVNIRNMKFCCTIKNWGITKMLECESGLQRISSPLLNINKYSNNNKNNKQALFLVPSYLLTQSDKYRQHDGEPAHYEQYIYKYFYNYL